MVVGKYTKVCWIFNLSYLYMEKIGTCCFCGKTYTNYGNSTWGCWSREEEMMGVGEKQRCCNECNETVVIPSRVMLMRKREEQNYGE